MEKTFILKLVIDAWTRPIVKGVCRAETEEMAIRKLGLTPEVRKHQNMILANCKSQTGSLFLLHEIEVFEKPLPSWW